MKINKILSSTDTIVWYVNGHVGPGVVQLLSRLIFLVTPRVQISLVFHRPETRSISLVMLFIPQIKGTRSVRQLHMSVLVREQMI